MLQNDNIIRTPTYSNLMKFKMWCINNHNISKYTNGRIKIVRNILTVGFTIIGILGFITVMIGLTYTIDSNIYKIIKIPEIASLPTILMILGLTIFILCVIALLGVRFVNIKLLILFVAILTLILCAQIGLGITCYIKRNDLPKLADLSWTFAENSTRIYFETKFNCCGYYNITDRVASDPIKNICVINNTVYNYDNVYLSDMAYIIGCSYKLFKNIHQHIIIIICVSLICTIIEMGVIVMISLVICKIHKSRIEHSRIKDIWDINNDIDSVDLLSDTDTTLS